MIYVIWFLSQRVDHDIMKLEHLLDLHLSYNLHSTNNLLSCVVLYHGLSKMSMIVYIAFYDRVLRRA
jgi:hypothetical protein